MRQLSFQRSAVAMIGAIGWVDIFAIYIIDLYVNNIPSYSCNWLNFYILNSLGSRKWD